MMDLSGKAITDRYPSRMLCGKRYDNEFSFSSSSGGVPRTCFEDVVLVPLASWIFYLALVGWLFIVIRSSSRSNGLAPSHSLIHRKRETATSWTHRWPKSATALSIIYSLLVIAALLMNILEIVRLYLADRGAGLLPFTLASITIVLIIMHIPLPVAARSATSTVILIFWVFSLVFTSVQVATLVHLQPIEPRARTEYLDSDQIIDTGVIIGLYGLAVIVESIRLATILFSSDKDASSRISKSEV